MKDVLCTEAGCLTNVGPDFERDLVVWDDGHLTETASAFVAHKLIEPALADLINPLPEVANDNRSLAQVHP